MAQPEPQQALVRVSTTNRAIRDPSVEELPRSLIQDQLPSPLDEHEETKLQTEIQNATKIDVQGFGVNPHSSNQHSTPEFHNRTESNPRHDSSFHEPLDSAQNLSKHDCSSALHTVGQPFHAPEEVIEATPDPESLTVEDLMNDAVKRKHVLQRSALYFLEKGKYDKVGGNERKAAQCYKRLTYEDDQNGPIQGALAHCYLAIGQPIEALAHFQKALNFLPDIRDPNLWIGIATAYQQLNNPVNASHAYIRVSKLAPNFPQFSIVQYHLGCNLEIESRYEGAIKQFKNALLLEPDNTKFKEMTLLHIGHCFEQMKDIGNASAAYHAALRINKQSVPNTQKLAWLFFQQGNINKAIETLNDILSLEESNGATHYMLGRCYMRNEEFIKAHSHFEAAIKYNYNNPEAWCSCGVLYAQLGQLRQALQSFRVGTVQDASIPELWYNIGVLYENNNQITPAYFAYSQAIQKCPSFQVASYRRTLISNQNQIRTPGAYIHPKFQPNKDFFLYPPCYRHSHNSGANLPKGESAAEDQQGNQQVNFNDSMSITSRNGIPPVSMPSWNSSQAYIRSGPMEETPEGQTQRPQSIQIVPLQGTLVQQVLMTQNPQNTQTMSQFYPTINEQQQQAQNQQPQSQQQQQAQFAAMNSQNVQQRSESSNSHQPIIVMHIQENKADQNSSEGKNLLILENKRNSSQKDSGQSNPQQTSGFNKETTHTVTPQQAFIHMPQMAQAATMPQMAQAATMPQIFVQTPEGLRPAQIVNPFPTNQSMIRAPVVTMGSQGGLHQVMVNPAQQPTPFVQIPSQAGTQAYYTQAAAPQFAQQMRNLQQQQQNQSDQAQSALKSNSEQESSRQDPRSQQPIQRDSAQLTQLQKPQALIGGTPALQLQPQAQFIQQPISQQPGLQHQLFAQGGSAHSQLQYQTQQNQQLAPFYIQPGQGQAAIQGQFQSFRAGVQSEGMPLTQQGQFLGGQFTGQGMTQSFVQGYPNSLGQQIQAFQGGYSQEQGGSIQQNIQGQAGVPLYRNQIATYAMPQTGLMAQGHQQSGVQPHYLVQQTGQSEQQYLQHQPQEGAKFEEKGKKVAYQVQGQAGFQYQVQRDAATTHQLQRTGSSAFRIVETTTGTNEGRLEEEGKQFQIKKQ